MQLLAVDSASFLLLSGTQGVILITFGAAVLAGVGLFFAVRNNYFIKRSINMLTKKLEKINEKLRTREDELTETEKSSLRAKKASLETIISEKMTKAYSAVRYKDKRLEKFTSYAEKHVSKYPDLFDTLDADIKNLKDLLNSIVLRTGSSRSERTEDLVFVPDATDESLVSSSDEVVSTDAEDVTPVIVESTDAEDVTPVIIETTETTAETESSAETEATAEIPVEPSTETSESVPEVESLPEETRTLRRETYSSDDVVYRTHRTDDLEV